MKLKELLLTIDREKVFEIAYANMQKDILFNHQKADKEKVKIKYFAIIDEIKAMRNSKTQAGNLAVVKTKDFSGSERFDVFLIKPNDNEHYSLTLSAWSEYQRYEIHEKSLERYGAEIVAEAVIYDMTFFGTIKKQRDRRHWSMTKSLLESSRADPNTFIPAEQVFADLKKKFGYALREQKAEEQKAAEHEAMIAIQRENDTERFC